MAKISDAESTVMNVLWDEAPLDGEEIAARLKKQKWSRTTVRTLLARLVLKGAVKQKKAAGRKDQFSPLIERAAYQHAESRNLIDRLFDGKVSPLFAQLAEREDLTDEDIAELKALIERIEDDRR
ncbi:MAG TPA: BlaI/MecI/CopY family transcriptional regulator [Hyphomonadaceae bacterium]|jgi:predicted transcriptional regulator|nr:BlaI/MecI/CopY family transcriptional regulator [Hyphomonadaceae bacterium]